MKKIPEPDLGTADILAPAEMNRIHFGGIHTPLTPEQIQSLADGQSAAPKKPTRKSRNSMDNI